MRIVLAIGLSLAALGSATAEPKVQLRFRSLQPGELVLVKVSSHSARSAPRAAFRGEPVPLFSVSSHTYVGLIGLDLDVATGPAALTADLTAISGSTSSWTRVYTIAYKDFPTKRLTVEPNYAAPKEEDAARAEKEAGRLREIFLSTTPERYFAGPFIAPIPKALSSRFGERRIFNDIPKAPHGGADLRAGTGTPVKATAAGRVVLAEELFYQGKCVVLDHGWGLYSYYAHLSEISVAAGYNVEKGAVLGKVGRTGRVTGPHLHWSVRLHQARIDPFSLLYIMETQ